MNLKIFNFYFKNKQTNLEENYILIVHINNANSLFLILYKKDISINEFIFFKELTNEQLNDYFPLLKLDINSFYNLISLWLENKKLNLELNNNEDYILIIKLTDLNLEQKIILQKLNNINHNLLTIILTSKINSLEEENKYLKNKIELFDIDSNVFNNYYDIKFILKEVEKKLGKKIINLKLLYRASEHNGDANIFLEKCKGIKNTIVFIKSKKDKIFGGFTSNILDRYENPGWIVDHDKNTFLFSVDNKEIYNSTSPVIYRHNKIYGPIFGGGHDIQIFNNCFNRDDHSCKQYTFDYNKKQNALCGEINFGIKDYEVFEVLLLNN